MAGSLIMLGWLSSTQTCVTVSLYVNSNTKQSSTVIVKYPPLRYFLFVINFSDPEFDIYFFYREVPLNPKCIISTKNQPKSCFIGRVFRFLIYEVII